jgi:hypothetical protein
MKDVFTFWDVSDGGPKPGYVDLCQETVRMHCSGDFDLHFLDTGSMRDLVDSGDIPEGFDKSKDRALKAAFVMTALLVRHGGLWLEPDTMLLRRPVDVLEKALHYGLAACERGAGIPATSFIAAAPGNAMLIANKARIREAFAGKRRRGPGWPRLFRRRAEEWELRSDRARGRSF